MHNEPYYASNLRQLNEEPSHIYPALPNPTHVLTPVQLFQPPQTPCYQPPFFEQTPQVAPVDHFVIVGHQRRSIGTPCCKVTIAVAALCLLSMLAVLAGMIPFILRLSKSLPPITSEKNCKEGY